MTRLKKTDRNYNWKCGILNCDLRIATENVPEGMDHWKKKRKFLKRMLNNTIKKQRRH